MSLRERESLRVCLCACVCVSEMDRLWPGHINAPSDWLQLSRNVTAAPEQDLIGIWELLLCNRGRSKAKRQLRVNANSPPRAGGYSSAEEGWRPSRWPTGIDHYPHGHLRRLQRRSPVSDRPASIPQDETLRASLLQHHVIGPFRRGEDVRWQRGAEATCGAQVQLAHLQTRTWEKRSRLAQLEHLSASTKIGKTLPSCLRSQKNDFQKHVSSCCRVSPVPAIMSRKAALFINHKARISYSCPPAYYTTNTSFIL